MRAIRAIERLRAHRVTPRGAHALAVEIDAIEAELKRARSREGKAARAWREHAPEEIRALAREVVLKRGVLVVRADGASARFQIDRWLRTGGAAGLIRACAAREARVQA